MLKNLQKVLIVGAPTAAVCEEIFKDFVGMNVFPSDAKRSEHLFCVEGEKGHIRPTNKRKDVDASIVIFYGMSEEAIMDCTISMMAHKSNPSHKELKFISIASHMHDCLPQKNASVHYFETLGNYFASSAKIFGKKPAKVSIPLAEEEAA